MADTFPFAADDPVSGDGRSRKALLLVAAGVAVLGLLGYFVVLPALSGGSDAAPTAISVPARTPKKKAPAKKPAAKPATTRRTTTVYRDAIARDPFKALWYKPEQVTAPAPGTAPVAPPPAYPTTPTGGGSSSTVGGQRVALVKVFTRDGKQYAQTRVGDTVYTPVVGSTFAGLYKLLAVGTGSASYLYGDEQFSLREGQEVLK